MEVAFEAHVPSSETVRCRSTAIAGTYMKPPKGITDERKWIRHCCQIHARAKELREGKISLAEASVALGPLASWTRAESERDFEVFRQLRDELIELPIGRERE